MIKKLALVLLVGAAPPYVTAQTTADISAPSSHSYNQNSSGVITRSAFGLCWRSGSWTENDAIAGCDGALTSPIPNPIAPDLANSMTKDASPIAVKACSFSFVLGSDRTFAFNKASLSTAAKRQIDQEVLPRLTECKTIANITITGHTDNLGSDQSNQLLSEKRAQSVADYLKAKGVGVQMNVVGAGSSKALKSCSARLSHSKMIRCLAPNRRVSIEAINSK
ncbi:OmpA family protein [Herminiimonas aquatilis]|uniref:OmpA family protein n=1 Tax=Herminiimonas aquatilis TaxID=345342 RepID=A0ABW2J2Q9_9BURK